MQMESRRAVMGFSEELPDGGFARIEGICLPDSDYSKYNIVSHGEGLIKEANARLETQIGALNS